MKKRLFLYLFIAWIILWVFFTARELFIKGAFRQYSDLFFMSPEEKRSYVTGDRFYQFLVFCNERLPPLASYAWEGIEHGSIEQRRGAYYLYPHVEQADPEFLLVFDEKPSAMTLRAYRVFARLDGDRYVLARKAGGA
ncbi:hypothetical protein ACFL3N_00495 [Candidatus Omnitrophota bacterium]